MAGGVGVGSSVGVGVGRGVAAAVGVAVGGGVPVVDGVAVGLGDVRTTALRSLGIRSHNR